MTKFLFMIPRTLGQDTLILSSNVCMCAEGVAQVDAKQEPEGLLFNTFI